MTTSRWSKKRSVGDVFSRNSTLSGLVDQANLYESLERELLAQFDPAYREQIHVGRYENGVLVLIIATAALATRIRYMENMLLRTLKTQRAFSGLKKIAVTIRPRQIVRETPKKRLKPLSPASANLVQKSADNTTNPLLKAALERLASHCK